jgi:23S rRNA (cytosine1962-C5)-methyltransferase
MQTALVNRKAAARVDAGHPWIFRSDVLDTTGLTPGETVRVASGARTLGTAHYSAASQITLRMLSHGVEQNEANLFLDRLSLAVSLRAQVVRNTDAYRLVHAEGDGLPALIVDRYADYLVLQALDQGMDRATPLIVDALQNLLAPAGILARNDASVRTQEALPRESRILTGNIPEAVAIQMNGLRFHADLQHGMKTGVFLDQRENYIAAAKHARGMALDCFTSTGGFALHLAGTCGQIEAIDSSESALATAQANAARNEIANVNFREADVFDALVLDPPAFAKSRGHVDAARRAYKEINRRALSLLAPGGVLITCSCSHHFSEADLLEVLAESSLETKRSLRILERRTQASDHPILLTVPETLYLKCLILQDTTL